VRFNPTPAEDAGRLAPAAVLEAQTSPHGERKNEKRDVECFRTSSFPRAMGTLSLQRDRSFASCSSRPGRTPGAAQKLSRQKMASSHHRATGSIWSLDSGALVVYSPQREEGSLQRYLHHRDIGRPCPSSGELKIAFTAWQTRRSRPSLLLHQWRVQSGNGSPMLRSGF
jgi:hypothetical protein